MKNILSFLLILCSMSVLTAQPIRTATYDVMIETAETAEAAQDYYNALDWYEKAYEDKNVVSVALHIAQLHEKLRDYNRAERAYNRVIRKDKKEEYPELKFHHGRMLKMVGKYPEAVDILTEFISITDNDTLKQLAKSELIGAKVGRDFKDPVNGVTIENAGKNVNSKLSEYSPALAKGGKEMYFASFSGKDVIILDGDEEDYHAKIYKSNKGDKSWGKPDALDQTINREGYHTSNVNLATDGNRMYFTRALLEGNVVSESKIYMSAGGSGNWGAANEVKGVNGDFISLHPAVGELYGSEVLFFVSDMDGGFGGFDIYYATRKGGEEYSDPVNLGPKINTIGNEETPFYRDGMLYFSSTGLPGFGGYDIFSSIWDGAVWSEPTNMGLGYNSSVDDLSYYMDEEGHAGFLTSNRPGGKSAHGKTCCDDIYTLEIAKILADLVVGSFDSNKKPLVDAKAQLIEMTNNKMGATNAKENKEGNVFKFNLALETAYAVIVTKEGYYPDTVQFNTVGQTETKSYEKRLYLKKMPPPPLPEPEEPIEKTVTREEAILLENILYDFDDDKILDAAEQDLKYIAELMTQYPDMEIELSSHTDARGDASYNERLSQRRADSARRWLIRKGVSRSRIETKGYGKQQPQTVSAKVARKNSFLQEGDVLTEAFIKALNGEDVQEIAHQLNRRTEFKIIAGPTSITISTKQLQKQTSETENKSKNRKSNIKTIENDSIKINKNSSLYGKKDLKGLPIMTFKERDIDFGTIKKGETRHHVYEFHNAGDTALDIEIITACDCTTLEWTRSIIEPGKSGIIDVVFDSKDKDDGETIDIDIILNNMEPGTDMPIIERVTYKFEIEK